ncbi:hypothetical protein AWENTII_001361 [Aspergillus wentii]
MPCGVLIHMVEDPSIRQFPTRIDLGNEPPERGELKRRDKINSHSQQANKPLQLSCCNLKQPPLGFFTGEKRRKIVQLLLVIEREEGRDPVLSHHQPLLRPSALRVSREKQRSSCGSSVSS